MNPHSLFVGHGGGDGYEIIYSNSPFDDAETGTQREYGTCSPNFRAGVPLSKGQK